VAGLFVRPVRGRAGGIVPPPTSVSRGHPSRSCEDKKGPEHAGGNHHQGGSRNGSNLVRPRPSTSRHVEVNGAVFFRSFMAKWPSRTRPSDTRSGTELAPVPGFKVAPFQFCSRLFSVFCLRFARRSERREGAIPARMAWPPTPMARPHPLARSKPPLEISWPRKPEVGSYFLAGVMILLFSDLLEDWSAACIVPRGHHDRT